MNVMATVHVRLSLNFHVPIVNGVPVVTVEPVHALYVYILLEWSYFITKFIGVSLLLVAGSEQVSPGIHSSIG
jgi:hypothetical protein